MADHYFLAKILALLVLGIGIAVICGWIFDISVLKSIVPNYVTMKFSTSISFVFSGITLYFISRYKEGKSPLARLAIPTSGLIISLFMATLLLSTLIFFRSGIEDIFVPETGAITESVSPGRPSVPTMVSFILIVLFGIFSMSESLKFRKSLVWLGYSVIAIGSIAMIGYALNLPEIYYQIPSFSTAMAIHTCILFTMLGSGMVMLSSPSKRTFTKSIGIGKRLLYLFLISTIIPIIFVSSLSYGISKSDVSSDSFGLSLLIIGAISVTLVGIFSVFTSRSIVKPIIQLRNTASKISLGNMDVQADESSIGEFGDLAKSFNQMTHRIKEEETIKAKNEKMITIGQFSARLAHDLRNPLSVIMSAFALIELRNENQLGKKDVQDFDKVHRAIETMTYQINGVLDFVRNKPLHLTSNSLSTILENSLTQLKIPSNVTIQKPQNSVITNCDQIAIQSVLTNLIMNSIQAIGDKTGQISIRFVDAGDRVNIMIEDSGEGVTDQNMPKIFEPLFTTKQFGTGLGLVSCKNIVEQHGGKISITNNPTTVALDLPKSQ